MISIVEASGKTYNINVRTGECSCLEYKAFKRCRHRPAVNGVAVRDSSTPFRPMFSALSAAFDPFTWEHVEPVRTGSIGGISVLVEVPPDKFDCFVKNLPRVSAILISERTPSQVNGTFLGYRISIRRV